MTESLQFADGVNDLWECTAPLWADAVALIDMLLSQGPFVGMITQVDGKLETLKGPAIDVVSDGQRIAVRYFDAETRQYGFLGRSGSAAAADCELIGVDQFTGTGEEPNLVSVPRGLLHDKQRALELLEQMLSGTTPATTWLVS